MKLPEKVDIWLQKNCVPQRLLLVGNSAIDIAFLITSRLQDKPVEILQKGIEPDTMIYRDRGQLFPLRENANHKNADIGDNENAFYLSRWIQQKPVAPYRIIILERFERASHEVFEFLLKTIEEPPPQVYLIFTTENPSQFPDTILSRMTIVQSDTQDILLNDEVIALVIEFMTKMDFFQRFQFIQTLDTESKKRKSRKNILDFLDALIDYVRQNNPEKLEIIYETRLGIVKNGHIRLTLERLALHLETP